MLSYDRLPHAFFLKPWLLEAFPRVATNMPKYMAHLLDGRNLSLWQRNGTRMKLYLFYLTVMEFLPKWLLTKPNNRSWVSLIRNLKKLTTTWYRQSPTLYGLMPLRGPSMILRKVHHVKWFLLYLPISHGIIILNWKPWFVRIMNLKYICLMVKYHKLSWKYKPLIPVIFVNSIGING